MMKMNAINILFTVAISLLISCVNESEQYDKKQILDSSDVNIKIDSNKASAELNIADTVLENLPLGYADLFTHKFPLEWEMGRPIEGAKMSTHEKFLVNKVDRYYYGYFLLPNYRNHAIDTLSIKDSIELSIIKHIKFRLPDLKQYNVYLSLRSGINEIGGLFESGNLVLFDGKSKMIKFIEIHKFDAKFCYSFRQYFYINKGYTIKLKRFETDEKYFFTLRDTTIFLNSY